MRHRTLSTLSRLERWTLYSILIGFVAGIGAVIFNLLIIAFETVFLLSIANYSHRMLIENPLLEFRWYLFPLIVGIGGLFSGLLVYSFAPEAEGHGTDAVIKSLHELGGLVRRRVVLVKMLASAVTIGSGGSAGREGPIAQIGAGFGAWLAHLLKATPHDRRIMVMCGVASGIGAIFRAPLGAALFAVEVLYKRDFESEALIPVTISSIVAYAIYVILMSAEPALYVPSHEIPPIHSLPLYALLGVIAGLVAIVYVKVFYGMRDFVFKRIPIPRIFIPMVGGILTGLIGIFYPHTLGVGYEWIELVLLEELSLELMLALIFMKMLTTSFTISSGGSGGVFAPSLFMGAMIGGAFGALLQGILPEMVPSISYFAVVGMASFFAAAAKVPLASIVIVAEMTRGYELLVPTMIASVLAYAISGEFTIYENQVPSRENSPFHMRALTKEMLRRYKVRDILMTNFITFDPHDKVFNAIKMMIKAPYTAYPVVERSRLVGVILYRDLAKLSSEEAMSTPIFKVMKRDVPLALPDESLDVVLDRMLSYGVNVIMVVDSPENMRLLGVVTEDDVMRILWRQNRRATRWRMLR